MGSVTASVSCQRDRLETYGVCLTTVDCVLTGHQAMMVTVTQYQVPNWPSRFQPDGLTPCSSVFDRSLFVVRYRVIQSRWDESACAAQSDFLNLLFWSNHCRRRRQPYDPQQVPCSAASRDF